MKPYAKAILAALSAGLAFAIPAAAAGFTVAELLGVAAAALAAGGGVWAVPWMPADTDPARHSA